MFTYCSTDSIIHRDASAPSLGMDNIKVGGLWVHAVAVCLAHVLAWWMISSVNLEPQFIIHQAHTRGGTEQQRAPTDLPLVCCPGSVRTFEAECMQFLIVAIIRFTHSCAVIQRTRVKIISASLVPQRAPARVRTWNKL